MISNNVIDTDHINFESAAKEIVQKHAGQSFVKVVPDIASRNPMLAAHVAHLLAAPDRDLINDVITLARRKYSFADALSFARHMPKCPERDEMLFSLSNSLDVGDKVAMALKVLFLMGDRNRRYKEMIDRAVLCFDDDSAGCLLFAQQVLPQEWLQEFYQRLVDKLSFEDPQRALRVAMLHSTREEQLRSIDIFIRSFFPTCIKEAAAYLETIENRETRLLALNRLKQMVTKF